MIIKLFKYTMILLLLLVIALISSVFFVAEDNARVNQTVQITKDDVIEMRLLMAENRPDIVFSSNKKELNLSQDQSNKLMAYASQRFNNKLQTKVAYQKDKINLDLSYRLPDNPLGKFLNVSTAARVTLAKNLVVEELKIGKLVIPSLVITLLQPLAVEYFANQYSEYHQLWRYLKRINVAEAEVTIHYRLERSDLAKVKQLSRNILVNSETKERVLAYTAKVHEILAGLPNKEQSLMHFMAPLFEFAKLRADKNQQRIEENRMALLLMGAYLTGRNPAKYVSDQVVIPFKKIRFTLRGRNDLSKHYGISAAINAVSGTVWSNAIGLEKELSDSDGGSGFSFVDLMADIAGNKLAQTALDENKATRMQVKMSSIVDESAIIATINGLPEGLTMTEFKLQYGNTNSDEYIAVIREIERRLYQCNMYR